MKIIVTGSDGYIGSRLVRKYTIADNEVFSWNRKGIHADGFEADYQLLNENEVFKALDVIRPNLILHCAGAPDVWKSIDDPTCDIEGNYLLAHNIFHSMRKLKMTECRIIVLSSAAIYGNPYKLPISENDKANPMTPYALHKHFSELLCKYMNKNYDLDTKVVRIFSVYGPGIRKQILWDMYNKIRDNNEISLFGDGSDSRDYIYIDDAVRAIALVADNAPHEETVYNIANGEEITIKSVAETFCDKYGVSRNVLKYTGKARAGDPANWLADISKIKLLGYKKSVEFEDGVEKYVNWLRTLD